MADFEEFVTLLRVRNDKPISTGMKDLAGQELRTGDVVAFWFDANIGFSAEARDDMTRMVDVVEAHDGGLFAIDYDTQCGLALWKIDGACSVVGDVHRKPDVLRRGLLRFRA